LRRPPTSCAHRLRKPNRTCGPLALPVARRLRSSASTPRPDVLSSPCSRPGFLRPLPTTQLERTPPRQTRIPRRRFRTATSPEPERLPSDRPSTLRPKRTVSRLLSHLHATAPHPFVCRDPIQPRQKAWRSLQTTPLVRGSPCGSPRPCGEDASHQCLQPTYVTSTLRTDRFPSEPPVGLAASLVRLSPARAETRTDEPARGRSHEQPGWSIA